MQKDYELPGFVLNEKIYESTLSVIFKGINEKDKNLPVVIKFHKSDVITRKDIEKIENEYKLLKKLKNPGIVNVYSLENYGSSKVFVFEDFGAISLNEYLKKHKLNIAEFLEIAIKLVDIIYDIHKSNIIHKDIKPHNILINEKTKEIKFIDFGIACQLRREMRSAISAERLEGTLSYISPEQTGRMNRTVDYRTDYYSLGVTFYEMLTGKLPFESKDPLELVHSHMAKLPISPTELNKDIPDVISNIIMKLMSKNAEERYQSERGLKHDLEKYLKMFNKDKSIKSFTIGEMDVSETFQIPEKLYGREKEISILLGKFETSSSPEAKPYIIFFSGAPGIGKSSLINEIHKPLVEKRGYFIQGKYDQFRRSTPFSAIIGAFSDLINQLLSVNEQTLNEWKRKILIGLGDNGNVIIEVIPQLKLIIGEQPAVPQLSPAEAENRFSYVFENFTRVFAKEEHPLIIFLDDLQWADSASLKWLNIIFNDNRLKNFLFIGAYRDNEITMGHPFMLFLDDLKKAYITWDEINLTPLTEEDISQILSETLLYGKEETRELAGIIRAKTGGNPFFIQEFIKSLYENEMITFDDGWKWDIKKIREGKITDNVVDFMTEKIEKLPENTQRVMKIASCAGINFYLDTIAMVYGKSEEETIEALKQAINDGMIIKLEAGLKFSHDRVREAVYGLLIDEEKKKYHYELGKTLLKSTTEEQLDDRIFNIVHQLNLAVSIITDREEKINIAKLNLKAGIKAKASTANEAANKFLNTGIALLPEGSWETLYDLTLSLYTEAGEAEYLVGNHEKAEEYFNKVLDNTKDILDKVKVYSIQIPLFVTNNKMDIALKTGIKGLALLGLKLPKKANKLILIKELIMSKRILNKITKKNGIDSILDLPIVTNPRIIAILQLICTLDAPTFIAFPDYMPILVLRLFCLSLVYGNSEYSAHAYTAYGFIQCGIFGKYDFAYKIGEIALKLNQKIDTKIVQSKVDFIFGNMINHWKKPLQQGTFYLEEGYKVGLETGSLQFASYSIYHLIARSLYTGENLAISKEKAILYYDIIKKLKQLNSIINYQMYFQIITNLTNDKLKDKVLIIGSLFNENKTVPEWEKVKHLTSLGTYAICKQFINYLYNEYKNCIKYSIKAEKYLKGLIGMPYIKEHYYYYTLAMLGDYPSVKKSRQKKYLMIVNKNLKKIKHWAFHCPENVLHKQLFIEAELAVRLGKTVNAMELYDRAAEQANRNGFVNEEGMIYEHASLYYKSLGRDLIADLYIKKSYLAFQNWGAITKLEDLKEKHGNIFQSTSFDSILNTSINSAALTGTSIIDSSSSSTKGTSSLDLNTVMKSATAISGEIVMDKLIGRLISIVMENAGAERAVLLLNKNNNFVIEASGQIGNTDIEKLNSIPLENAKLVPETIILYVARSKETVVLNNAYAEGPFTKDEYIQNNKIKSVLCSPIMNKANIIGIIYLENNLAANIFTKERLQIINILSGQIGISIDNASLYEQLEDYSKNLEKKVEERTRELKIAHEKLSAQHEIMKAELKMAQKVQTSFLPKKEAMEKYSGLIIAGQYASMEDLGGDIYDVIKIDDNRYGFIMADVSGHGISASLMTAMAKVSFNSNMLTCKSTNEICTNVNKEICNLVGEMGELDLTAYIGILEIDTGRFEFTNAAHHPAILVRKKTKQIERPSTDDIYIGLLYRAKYTSGEIRLEHGDRIVLFTDGIVETMNNKGSFYDIDRLIDITIKSINDTPEKYVNAVLDDVMVFSDNAPPHDDMAILCVDYI